MRRLGRRPIVQHRLRRLLSFCCAVARQPCHSSRIGSARRRPSATQAIPEGDVTGGARPTSAVGGTGVGAGGLATGPAGIGGTRNLAHGTGRPAGAYGTAPSEPTQTSEEDVVGEANAAEQG